MADAATDRGVPVAYELMGWIGERLGRRAARFVLYGVVAYFMIAAPAARRASRHYLRRVLSRPPRWRDCYRHLYTFAAVFLDQMYLIDGARPRLSVAHHGVSAFRDCIDRRQGAIIMVSHVGSFEALRALSGRREELTVRILMDRSTTAQMNAALHKRFPTMADRVIDTSTSDVDRVLKIKAALDRGEMIGIMADRHHGDPRSVDCDFLDGSASFPMTPWLLAGMLQVPVFLAFGLYRGGDRYELYCELFSTALSLPRCERTARAGAYAQAYADRLAEYVKYAPYNWFNFYEFWH